ncbi:MAG: Holliday junction branch migration protein RuvA [Desulfovibrio sp.]|nr:Holliday junction branch migration protein RuvA [Desulfovibrio sp.]
MIARVAGDLMETGENSCLVSTAGGEGYEIFLPAHTFNELPAKGSAVAFYTWMIVREDARELFGFATWEERNLFGVLISISKVGPRSALSILSLYRPAELQAIVNAADEKALSRVSGIGLKTARHILLELSYKLEKSPLGPTVVAVPVPGTVLSDALAALANLGYEESECADLVREIIAGEADADVGSVIRQTLKKLAKRRG